MTVNCNHLPLSKAETAFGEQHVNIQLSRRLKKSLTETLHILYQVYSNSERAVCSAKVFSEDSVLREKKKETAMAAMSTISSKEFFLRIDFKIYPLPH